MINKKLTIGSLILIAALALAGCGSKTKVSEGYYVLSEITEGDVTVSEKDLDEYGLEDSYLVFDDSGDGYMVLMDTPNDFTYNKKKGVMETYFGDVNVTTKGKTVTLSDSEVSMTFTKSKKDAPKKPDYPLSDDTDEWTTDGGDGGGFDWGGSSGGYADACQEYWNADWFGWWELNGFMNDWDQYEDQKFSVLARSELDADGNGRIVLYDSEGELADAVCSNNGHGLTDAGTMISESGYFLDKDLGHADWNIDPGTSPGDHDDYIYIDGHYEDENGGFTYTIHLVKWGTKWDGFDQDELPDDYEWYLEQINSGASMPDEVPN